MSEKPKHLIVLGAGASVTSGYPVADGLRLLMSSDRALKEKLKQLNEQLGPGEMADFVEKTIGGEMEETIHLFRHGCFSTVDEFSALAGLRFPKQVQSLKKVLRTALSLHNPEDTFENSDYYVFVQRLFHKGLFPLRNDISILTFNYDPYLPYLLEKADGIRGKAAGNPTLGGAQILTSGFAGRLVGQVVDAEGFCFLQLHGTIAWPEKIKDEPVVSYDDLFHKSFQERLRLLSNGWEAKAAPPIVFPWEIMNDDGGFVEEHDFCLTENCDENGRRQGSYSGRINLHQLFKAIWKRAQKEVTLATKISFVGLSMHEFLDPAFKFLFAERKENAQIVSVNKEHEKFRGANYEEALVNPRSPTFKLRRLLKGVCQQITGLPLDGAKSRRDGFAHVSVRETFREFINEELEPM